MEKVFLGLNTQYEASVPRGLSLKTKGSQAEMFTDRVMLVLFMLRLVLFASSLPYAFPLGLNIAPNETKNLRKLWSFLEIYCWACYLCLNRNIRF